MNGEKSCKNCIYNVKFIGDMCLCENGKWFENDFANYCPFYYYIIFDFEDITIEEETK